MSGFLLLRSINAHLYVRQCSGNEHNDCQVSELYTPGSSDKDLHSKSFTIFRRFSGYRSFAKGRGAGANGLSSERIDKGSIVPIYYTVSI